MKYVRLYVLYFLIDTILIDKTLSGISYGIYYTPFIVVPVILTLVTIILINDSWNNEIAFIQKLIKKTKIGKVLKILIVISIIVFLLVYLYLFEQIINGNDVISNKAFFSYTFLILAIVFINKYIKKNKQKDK